MKIKMKVAFTFLHEIKLTHNVFQIGVSIKIKCSEGSTYHRMFQHRFKKYRSEDMNHEDQ